MTLNDAISEKLRVNASRVNDYIYSLLEPRKPEVLYEASKHIFQAGGKRLRPYLVMNSCEAVGGDPDVALPFAAALEVLHNFTLVHDDIMDNDSLRRGAPTVHIEWGVPIAIAAGDLLFAKVYEAMYHPYLDGVLTGLSVMKCISKVTEATIAICEGQVLDVSYPDTKDVTEDDYIFMVGAKTSALFKACAEIGAIAGGADDDQIERLGSFAWDAGIAFQIADDILGATASEETLGKPVGSDLREGKKTLIIIHALNKATTGDREAILRVMGKDDPSPIDMETAIEALENIGSIDYAKKIAEEHSNNARAMLEPFPETEAKRNLLEMLEYFTSRSY